MFVFYALSAGVLDALGSASAPTVIPDHFNRIQAFNFLFVAIGPIGIVPQFATLTARLNSVQTRSLAAKGIAIAMFTVALTATLGAITLDAWGVQRPALQLSAGLLLLLVALLPLIPFSRQPQYGASQNVVDPDISLNSGLPLRPLAFPIIMPAFSLCVVALIAELARDSGNFKDFVAIAMLILVLDFLFMLVADRLMRSTIIRLLFDVMGNMMGALQVSLALQTMLIALS